MRDAKVRFGVSGNFAGRELSLVKRDAVDVSERILQSNSLCLDKSFVKKAEKYLSLYKNKNSIKSNSCLKQTETQFFSNASIYPENAQQLSGGGDYLAFDSKSILFNQNLKNCQNYFQIKISKKSTECLRAQNKTKWSERFGFATYGISSHIDHIVTRPINIKCGIAIGIFKFTNKDHSRSGIPYNSKRMNVPIVNIKRSRLEIFEHNVIQNYVEISPLHNKRKAEKISLVLSGNNSLLKKCVLCDR